MERELITLAKDTIDNSDIDSLISWLKTYPRLTKGVKNIQFEKEWSKWIGTKYSVFVNSGSSANLLMLYALIAAKKLKNKKIVVPALAWATDLSPVMQLGLEPIIVDCNLSNLAVDTEHLETIFKEQNPSALILVSVLGFTPDMDKITELCNKYNVTLLEDVCESLGSTYHDKKLGNFGLMSSFSLYYGHHLSCIEGGVICTDDEEMYDMLKMIRSHGWSRDLEEEKQLKLKEQWNVSNFNNLYTFYVPGFNVRATDLQAYLGIDQLKKADDIVKKRNENYLLFNKLLKNSYWSPEIPEHAFISNFCYPIIHPNREKIVKSLQENNVEVRPLICGSMSTQPFYVAEYGRQELPNVSIIDKYGAYIPNHAELKKEEIEFMCDVINKAME